MHRLASRAGKGKGKSEIIVYNAGFLTPRGQKGERQLGLSVSAINSFFKNLP
jgi:hypothetical protein